MNRILVERFKHSRNVSLPLSFPASGISEEMGRESLPNVPSILMHYWHLADPLPYCVLLDV
jgi:hypothetical protein